MLDVHGNIKLQHRPGLGLDGPGVVDDRDGVGNPWEDDADIGIGTATTSISTSTSPNTSHDPDPASITPTTPRGPAHQGFGYTNGSATASSTSMNSSPAHSVKSGSGLRSRKASANRHRRVSSLNGTGSPVRCGSSSNPGSRPGSVSAHPLSSASASASVSSMRRIESSSLMTLDGAITRPALKRRLGSESEFYYDDSERRSSEGDLWVTVNEGDAEQKTAHGEAETMVIVHEVSQTDSIAGVALKYGISLADLRRANHLWTSDSIHLRRVLYIPLHLSSRKDLYFPSNRDDVGAQDGAARAESSSTAQTRSSVVIQRIPASQLAFFPPPSSSSSFFRPSLSPNSERKRRDSSIPFRGSVPSQSPGPSPSPRRVQSVFEGSDTTKLSALLQALPLPLASRPRELFSLPFPRISGGDSNESSTNVSETSSEFDQEHEMDVLGTGTSRRGHNRSRSRSQNRSRTHVYPNSDDGERADHDCGTVRRKERYHRASTASIETLKKSGYGPTEEGGVSLVPLQTEQLKPSPMMQLPIPLRRDGG